jgi:hypothetical protein
MNLESLSKWLVKMKRFNKLRLNVTKTKYMIIRRNRLDAGAHNDLCIDDVASMNYLRSSLTFKKYFNLTTRKMAKKIRLPGRI